MQKGGWVVVREREKEREKKGGVYKYFKIKTFKFQYENW